MYTPETVQAVARAMQTDDATHYAADAAHMLEDYAATLKAAQGGVTEAMVDAPLAGRWHHGNGALCCGSFRIARADWEAGVCAADGLRDQVFDWIVATLNRPIAAMSAEPAAQGEAVAEVYKGAFGIHYIACADPNKLPVGTKLYTAPPAQRVPDDTGRIDWMEANARSVSFGKAPTQGYWVHVQGIGYSGGSNRSLREAIDAARKAQAADLAATPAAPAEEGDGKEVSRG